MRNYFKIGDPWCASFEFFDDDVPVSVAAARAKVSAAEAMGLRVSLFRPCDGVLMAHVIGTRDFAHERRASV